MITLILFAIFLAIALGYVTRINIGLFAIAFAYIIGSFFMGLKPKEIINFWPMSIFFIIFAVSLFYNFAQINGTLEKLALNLVKRFQNHPYLLPFAVFIVASIIAAMGAGFYSVLAFMAPITFLICAKSGLSRIGGAIAINYGALAGANFPTSQSGIIFTNLMKGAGVDSDTAFINAFWIFLVSFILPFFVIAIFAFKAKVSNVKVDIIETIEPFDRKQKITLVLMILMMLSILIFPILHILFPDNAGVNFMHKNIDIGFVAIFFVLLALLFKLGSDKKVIALVPWDTLIMICGVGILISIALKAGVIDELSSFLGKNIPVLLIPIAMMIIAAFMSLFSSTLGVVTPALFPVVPGLALASGIDPAILFISIVIGAQASAISPFSSGGSLVLGCAEEEYKNTLFKELIFKAVPLCFAAAFASSIILMIFF